MIPVLYQKPTEKSVVFLKTIEKQSVKTASFPRFDCLWLFQFKPLKQPFDLLLCQLFCLCFVPRPPETAVVKPFVKKKKTVAFPEESFQSVTSSSAEQEQSLTVWIQLQLPLYDFPKSVDSSAQIGVSGDEIYLRSGRELFQHDFRADRTVVSCSGDTFPGRVTVIPPDSMRISEEDAGLGGSRDTI